MSHFAVSIITKGRPTEGQIAELLAPYQENNMGDCPKKYLRFFSTSKQSREQYETRTQVMFSLSDGSICSYYDDRLYEEVSKEAYYDAPSEKRKITDKYYLRKDEDTIGAKKIEVPFKEIYPTFEDYMKNYERCELDKEMQDYGYWENPNAKWDWWVTGGRWGGSLIIKKEESDYLGEVFPYEPDSKNYKRVNCTRVQNIQNPDKDLMYQEALRFWELKVEGKTPETKEEENKLKFNFYSPKYYLNKYGDKESYAKAESFFYTFALIDKEGKWLEPGEMGWFGMSTTTHESFQNYIKEFTRIVYTDSDEDDYITVVDCHI